MPSLNFRRLPGPEFYGKHGVGRTAWPRFRRGHHQGGSSELGLVIGWGRQT